MNALALNKPASQQLGFIPLAIPVVAQAAPAVTAGVVKAIGAAISFVAGIIGKNKQKVAALKAQVSDIKAQNAQLETTNKELDSHLNQATQQAAAINNELANMGLAGIDINAPQLDGLKDWLKKTFAPKQYAAAKVLETEVAKNKRLTTEVNTKISTLQSLQTELQALANKYTTAVETVTTNKTVKWVAGGIAGLGLLAFLNYKFKWIKF